MSAITVFKTLLEVFPQVDRRALKAVAVEHKKDSDVAVLAVLNEIIPFLEGKSRPSSSSGENSCLGTRHPITVASSDDGIFIEAADSDEQQKGSSASLPDENDPRYDDYHAEVQVGVAESSDAVDAIFHAYNAPDPDIGWSDENLGRDLNIGGYEKLDEEKACGQDKMSSLGSCNDLVVEPNMLTVNPKIYESDCPLIGDSENEAAAAVYDSFSSMLSGTSQIFSVEVLEGIIDDAKNNEKILTSAVESMLSLMSEVYLKEITVEPTKLEASVAGQNLLTASEDLQKRSQVMKEENYIRAGEIYGDRVLLATEMKALHLRLQSLSEEKERSLKILDEMHGTLQSRLAAIEIETKAAEKEKLEKDELGRRSLAEQELIMGSLVEESKMLNQEVEENNKLRGFLGSNGRVIDMLQGEISVICQDVKLLKEKFDKSFSFSKPISCILTPSSTILKSVPTDHASEVHGDQFEDSFEHLQESDILPDSSTQQFSVDQLVVNDEKVIATQASEVPGHQFEESFEHLQKSDAVPAIGEQQFSNDQMVEHDKKEVLEDGWETI